MLTKNLTPFLFGAKLVSRKPPQPEVAIVVRGTFSLEPGAPQKAITGMKQGNLTAEVFHEDDEDRLGECLYPGDFADFKPSAEVFLKGSCHPPRGAAVAECGVRFTVGAWTKDLRVVGQRVWTESLVSSPISDPQPFTKMPITWANAFGGPELKTNPVGKGYKTPELPSVEDPRYPLRSRSDRPEPAGFGPINPAWPPRAGKMGKEYGKSYQAERAPFFAEDFDWTYFNAAPRDQQLPGYLRGDEELAFHNLHPKAAVLTARLPGLRVRAFIKDVEGRFREIPLSLDTLLADLDQGTLNLTWRGVGEVRERDLSDLAFVLIASEPLTDRPLPEKHYQALMEEFAADPTGIKAALPPGFLDAADRHKRRQAGEIPASDPWLDPVSNVLQQKMGKLGAAQQAEVKRAMAELFARTPPEANLTTTLTKALAEDEARAADVPPVPFVRRPGAIPNVGLRRTMRLVMEKTDEVRQKLLGQKDIPPEKLSRLEEMDKIPHDPRWKQIDPDYEPPFPLSTYAPGPGVDLRDRDFSHQDLRGVDLRGACLEGAILTGCNLSDCKLTGADLRNAILFKADLSRADCSGADFRRANAARVVAPGVNLSGANLIDAFFEDADLRGANLRKARGEYTVFGRANLEGVDAEQVNLRNADFKEARLTQANLRGATLISCLFSKSLAARIDLGGALLSGSSFACAVLEEARFHQARGERCLFIRAKMDGADFTYSIFPGSHFTEASAIRARFSFANLKECRFYRAVLDQAEIIGANLFQADLCKARLNATRFTDSSLYGAQFLEAAGAGCDFGGANLKRSTLERA